MKKSLREQLNRELDLIIPELPKSVVDAPINVKTEVKRKNSSIKEFFSKLLPNRKALAIFSTALACFMTLLVAIPFMTPKKADGTVVLVEINPSIRIMSTDGDKVSGVVSNNSDGDVILSDEEFFNSLKGKTIQDVVNEISHKAVEYGYITGADTENRIKISVLKDSEEKALDTAETLEQGLIDFMCENGVFAIVDGDKMTKEDYSQKFGQTIEKISDAIKYFRKIPALTIDTIFNAGENMLSQYAEMYQTFIEDMKNKIGDVQQKYADLMSIGFKYAPFRDFNIDPFDRDLELFEPFKSMHEDFLEEVDAFNQKYGENLTEERFIELSKLKEIFDAIGREPVSTEDFGAKITAMLYSRANAFKDSAREFFNSEKPKITKEQYADYVRGNRGN